MTNPKETEKDLSGANPLRMSAYYYQFESTGVRPIDEILSAVACAGKAFHHTSCWGTIQEDGTETKKIQDAAIKAANAYDSLKEQKSFLLMRIEHYSYTLDVLANNYPVEGQLSKEIHELRLLVEHDLEEAKALEK